MEVCESLLGKTYIGRRMGGISKPPSFEAITKVVLLVDGENAYEAGDESGRTIESECPYATQSMADDLLAMLKGYAYKPATASNALIDPAAECGDGMTADGIYTIIAQIETDYDSLMASEVSAPGQEEIESEYKRQTKAMQLDRKIAITRSLITKTAEQIRLEVENEIEGLSASFTVELDRIGAEVVGAQNAISSLELDVDSIMGRVQDAEDNIAQLELTATSFETRIQTAEGDISVLSQEVDGFSLRVSDVETGLEQTVSMTADGILISNEDGSVLEIDGGQLKADSVLADSIRLYDEMRIYTEDSGVIGGYARVGYFGYYQGWTTDEDGNLVQTDGVGIRYSSTRGQLNCTDAGVWCGYGSSSGMAAYRSGVTITADSILLDGTVEGNSASVTTSDSRLKTEIDYDMTDRLAILYQLKPCTYRRTEGQRRHSGLIAQEVEAARDSVWVSSNDYATLCINRKGYYGVRYTELVPDIIAAIQDLNVRLSAMEGIS